MPLYESAEDRRHKREFYDRWNSCGPDPRIRWVDNPDDGRVLANTADMFGVCGDQLVAISEYKRRKMPFGKYSSIMIDTGKLKCLMDSTAKGVQGIFYVECDDKVCVAYVCNPAHLTDPRLIEYRKRGGRTFQTRDDHDVEPTYYISNKLFVPVRFRSR